MAFDLTSLITGGGGAFLGFVGGALRSSLSADGRYSKRIDARLIELEAAVRKCEEERPQIAILKMGVCMVVTALQAKDRHNPVLKQVAAAFSALPHSDGSFDELMRKLDEVPGINEPAAEEPKP